ncbi:MAG TPA: PaeR7I family type II restriction endonuclease, partial [Polyangia bacterium]|nr:PaeR7I family type II restriction endonuclease [Polyangia bacterium]
MMPFVRVNVPTFESRLNAAIAHYWKALDAQAAKQGESKTSDRGRRAAVTGGKQMDGFCKLVNWLLLENGLGEASIYVHEKRQIPGFFRPTKDWDMLVVHEGHLVHRRRNNINVAAVHPRHHGTNCCNEDWVEAAPGTRGDCRASICACR